MLQVIGDGEHPEHAAVREWLSGDFDPEACDLAKINAGLRPRRR